MMVNSWYIFSITILLLMFHEISIKFLDLLSLRGVGMAINDVAGTWPPCGWAHCQLCAGAHKIKQYSYMNK